MKTIFLADEKLWENQQVNQANVRQQLSQYEITCVSMEIRKKNMQRHSKK